MNNNSIIFTADERKIISYPYCTTDDASATTAEELILTNKRLIASCVINGKKGESALILKDIPLSAIDTIESTLTFRKKPPLVAIIIFTVLTLLGVGAYIFGYFYAALKQTLDIAAYCSMGVGALGLLISLLSGKRECFFALKICTFGHGINEYLSCGTDTDAMMPSQNTNLMGVTFSYQVIERMLSEIGSLIMLYKNGG